MSRATQSAIATLHAAEWIPMTAVRVLIGIFFCISGGTKLLVPTQFSIMEHTLVESHVPFPHASALFVSLIEFAWRRWPGARAAHAPLCARAWGRHDRRARDEPDPQHSGERRTRLAG
jgi:hypothetical protein